MSATLANVDEVCGFMDAKKFTTAFRPVQLTEYVKRGSCVHLHRNWLHHALTELVVLMFAGHDILDHTGTVIRSLPPCSGQFWRMFCLSLHTRAL